MSRTIHVACGDCALGNLLARLSLPPEDVATLYDDLSFGPLGALKDVESWGAMRRAFWRPVCGEPVPRDFVDRADRIADAEEVVLWVGAGLADQLTLAWMPSFLRAIGGRVEALRVVQFERTSAGAPISHLGYLPEAEILRHPPPRRIDDEGLAYLEDAWGAVTSPEPVLVPFLARESVPLPLLKSALKNILRRYPDARSGVNWFEEQLLASMLDLGPAVAGVVGEAMREIGKAGQDAGDIWLFWRLRRLADPTLPHPALTMTGALTTMRRTEVRLTPIGEHVARGEANFVALNGIDDWVGGVHLDSRRGDVWFHRDGAIVRS